MTRRQAGREYGVLMFVVFSVLSDSVLVFGDGRRAGREYGASVFVGHNVLSDSGLELSEIGDESRLAGRFRVVWC